MRGRRYINGAAMALAIAGATAPGVERTPIVEARAFAPRGALALRPEAFGLVFESLVDDKDAHVAANNSPVAVIDVVGPLMHHEEFWFDSYDAIKNRVRDAVAQPTTKCVLLSIDSPGGLVAGCFDTVAELRRICAAAGKKLYAYVDSQACSGGYALACAAERIFIPSTGIAGSIGVIDTIMDQTAADEQWGMKFAVIASGARKADGNPHVSISDESISAAQKLVDTLAGKFFELVANARGLSVDAVQSYQAGLYCGQQAIDAGLADEIATLDEVVAMLASSDVQPEPNSGSQNGDSAMTLAEHKAALKSIADDKDANDSDREEARKMLAALDGGGEETDDNTAGATSEGAPEDETKASGETGGEGDDPDKEPDGDEAKKASAAAASSLALAARVQELEKQEASRKAAAERSKLMASRPDFAPEVVAFLAKQPLSVVRTACAKPEAGGLPRGNGKGGQLGAARAALSVTGTTPGGVNLKPPTTTEADPEGDEMSRRMGITTNRNPIVTNGTTLSLGVMTRERALEHLANKRAEEKALNGVTK